jgi:hypothetical protein
MDLYLKKVENLKRPNQSIANVSRSTSVSRSASPQPQSSVQNDEHKLEVREVREVREVKKLVYKNDLVELSKNIETVKNDLNVLNSGLNDKLNSLASQMQNLKNELIVQQEQSKTEKLKDKLNDFISKYNENEISHSDNIKQLETSLNELDVRVKDIELIL